MVGIISSLLLFFRWKPAFIVPLRFLAATAVWPVIAMLTMVLGLGFGPSIAFANLLLDVTAETTPLGEWKVHQFGILQDADAVSSGTEIRHSMIYDDVRVHNKIGDWIEESADNAQRTSASEVDIDINGVYLETT